MILAFIFVFIVYRTVSYVFERLFRPSGDIFDKLRQHSTYALVIATLKVETINISSAAQSKRMVCNLPFENQLFGYIYYCTEINISLLPDTCNFHRRFWFTFSLNFSEKAQNVHFREAKFQNFPGGACLQTPPPPSVLLPSALDTIYTGLTMNCLRRDCYFQWVILSIILRILRTQNDVSFFSRKRVHLPYYTQDILILRTADRRSAQA